MSKSTKLSILVQEGARRARNTSKELPWSETCTLLNKLTIQMFWAGYTYSDREIVIRRILAKLDNDNMSNVIEVRPFYRSKQDRRNVIKSDKATWFRDMGATATLMVPTTTGSKLAKELRELVVRFPGPRGTSLKIVEKPGKSIMSSLTSKPVIDTCHNPKCPIEASGNLCNNQCRTENVIYEA